jgi:molybdopterin-guanine dinucleotide biosynthesis protein A
MVFRMAEERIVAAILAGGAGARLGGCKALTPLAGAPLAAHVARALGAGAHLAIVGDAEAARVLKAVAIEDPPGAARGPLAGVLAALTWAEGMGAEWVALAPCDTPFLPDDLIARMRAAAGACEIACVESAAGLEPLISIWRIGLTLRLRAALAGGAHPAVHAFMGKLGAARVRLARAEETLNVNTPEDLARAEAYLARR